MKVGEKVYCISTNENVVIADQVTPTTFTVYGKVGYYDVPSSDLLEIEPVVPVSKPKYQTINCASVPRVPQTPNCEYVRDDFVGKVSSSTQPKNEKKEGISMNVSKLFGEFGKVKNGEVALTFGGQIAIRRSADEYASYDAALGQIVNQMSLVIKEASDMIFILPVTAVAPTDVIKFKGDYYQVLDINTNGSISGINLNKGTKSTICKETNLFGINFYYKVQSLFSAQTAPAMAELFDKDGNPVIVATPPAINPMMLMMLSKDGSSDFGDMLPLLMLSGGLGGQAGASGGIANNPLLLMSLLGDKESGNSSMKDLLPLMLLGGGLGGAATAGAIDPLMLMLLMK